MQIINTADNFICELVIKVHDCYSLLVKLSDSFMALQRYWMGLRLRIPLIWYLGTIILFILLCKVYYIIWNIVQEGSYYN